MAYFTILNIPMLLKIRVIIFNILTVSQFFSENSIPGKILLKAVWSKELRPRVALPYNQNDFYKKKHTKIPIEMLIELVMFCIGEVNYFSYKNRYYQQERGLFMGSLYVLL